MHSINAAMSTEPKTFEEAVKSKDSGKWLEAMDSELKSFKKNVAQCFLQTPRIDYSEIYSPVVRNTSI